VGGCWARQARDGEGATTGGQETTFPIPSARRTLNITNFPLKHARHPLIKSEGVTPFFCCRHALHIHNISSPPKLSKSIVKRFILHEYKEWNEKSKVLDNAFNFNDNVV
jgi:hypothetical protein